MAPSARPIWSVQKPNGRIVLQGLFWIGWAAFCFQLTWWITWALRLEASLSLLEGTAQRADAVQDAGAVQDVRHPLYLGFIIAFWSTPRMTVGHLLFAPYARVYPGGHPV